MITLATLVDWGALGEATYISVLVGLGVLVVAALAVAASLKAAELRESGSGGVAVYGAGTVLGVLVLVACVAYGIYVMTR